MNLGIDIGAVNVKLALSASEKAEPRGVSVAARGEPRAALDRALELLSLDDELCLSVGLTGRGSALFSDLPARQLSEVLCPAVAARRVSPRTRTVIDLGGRLSKRTRLDEGRRSPSSTSPQTGSARPARAPSSRDVRPASAGALARTAPIAREDRLSRG